jgi:hypothetical protein
MKWSKREKIKQEYKKRHAPTREPTSKEKIMTLLFAELLDNVYLRHERRSHYRTRWPEKEVQGVIVDDVLLIEDKGNDNESSSDA